VLTFNMKDTGCDDVKCRRSSDTGHGPMFMIMSPPVPQKAGAGNPSPCRASVRMMLSGVTAVVLEKFTAAVLITIK